MCHFCHNTRMLGFTTGDTVLLPSQMVKLALVNVITNTTEVQGKYSNYDCVDNKRCYSKYVFIAVGSRRLLIGGILHHFIRCSTVRVINMF